MKKTHIHSSELKFSPLLKSITISLTSALPSSFYNHPHKHSANEKDFITSDIK